jgi:hypothetical protein
MVGNDEFNLSGSVLWLILFITSCGNPLHQEDKNLNEKAETKNGNLPVASRMSTAKTEDGSYISWKEHLIDSPEISGVPLSGSDGLILGDLDQDGYQDIVSVHEGDTVYDGVPRGYIRIAYGSEDPDTWELVTLAEGSEAGAAEDVAIGDLNGDGWPDVVAACELSHLIYFQNPGNNIRSSSWKRTIPPVTLNRGSFIRIFCADFNHDGQLEVTSPNKGAQHVDRQTKSLHPIFWFEINGDPLKGESWKEHELTRVIIPENSRPVDLDGDGDLDIIGASRGEERIMWFENLGKKSISFKEHEIKVVENGQPLAISGVNMDFEDFNSDGRLDIVIFESPKRSNFGWIEQPADMSQEWIYHEIGTTRPDQIIGLVLADIDDDGNPDVMTGTYSGSPRNVDGDKTVDDVLGRIAWFKNPGNMNHSWIRNDISRRIRGMFDKFVPIDLDKDGDMDFVTTRGNSYPYDGVLWLEQVRSPKPMARFVPARNAESREMGLPVEVEVKKLK